MKIAIADNAGLKFCQDLKEHWEKKHEVRYERGASEHLAQWADLYYVEWIDGNLDYLWKIYNGAEGVSRTEDWDNNKKPKIVCRMIDWDVWVEYVPFYSQQYIDFIDTAIVIAPHIKDRIEEKANYGTKLHLIEPGVNLDKFPLKTQKNDGFQLGMVLGDMWWPKNHMGGLDIFTQLYRQNKQWRFHIRGQHEGGQYWPKMYEHYIESRGIKDVVKLYAHVDQMNQWYENIDILLHPGMKETFCYAVAESMSKGIPTVVNKFMGAEKVWDEGMLYETHDQAVRMIKQAQEADPKFIRKHIEKRYPLQSMLDKFDTLLGT